MVWGKRTDYAESPFDRPILMQLGDGARDEDQASTVVYGASTFLDTLAELAVADERSARACLDGLTVRGAIAPERARECGDADLVFGLAVDR